MQGLRLALHALLTMSTPHPKDASSENILEPKIQAVHPVASTKWLELKTIDYTDQQGKERKWDVATRTTRSAASSADAVVILPLLKHLSAAGDDDEEKKKVLDTLIVSQFRPPIGAYTVEFPAGLIDEGESPENAALRELREETGYVGEKCSVLPQVSRPLCMSPGITDELVHIVVVEVDLDNPYNQGTPKADLDEGEFVTVQRISLREGLQKVLDEGTGTPIQGVYLFAQGLEIGKSMT